MKYRILQRERWNGRVYILETRVSWYNGWRYVCEHEDIGEIEKRIDEITRSRRPSKIIEKGTIQ